MKLIYVAMFSVVSLALSSTGAGAQTWPTKPLRAVVPVVGSTTDIIPRIVLEQLSSQLAQSIIVENRAGAGATIGAGFVAKADPDGYTMLAHGSAHTISPSLYSKLNYHPARDFAAVIPLGITPSVLVVPPARLENRRRFRCRSQSKAWRFELLVGRHRDGNSPQCRTLPRQRGSGRRSCSVQGRRRGDE